MRTGTLVSTELSAAAARGRAIGALVITGFGALWFVSAAQLVSRLDWRVGIVIAVFSFALCLAAVRQLLRARYLPSTSQLSADQKAAGSRIRRRFGIVMAFEWVPIVAAVIVLNRLNHPELVVPAIALIVGLHFIPLAAIFRARLYYWTAAAMVAATLAAFAISNQISRQAAICAASGVILWITAALVLV